MSNRFGRVLALLMLILLGACSMRAALDAMTSPEDRAYAQRMVESLRNGDEAWLRAQFRPDLWALSGKQVGEAERFYPTGPATTDLVSFETSTRTANGRTEANKSFTLVTHGGGRWTVTNFRTFSEGGPPQVVQWSVTPHSAPPPELTAMETFDRIVPWLQAGLIVGVLLVGGLIFWLVRRSRRKHGLLEGQGSRTS
jgi:hypothetical protein